MEITQEQHEKLWNIIMDISEGKYMLSQAMHEICVLFGVSNVKQTICRHYDNCDNGLMSECYKRDCFEQDAG